MLFTKLMGAELGETWMSFCSRCGAALQEQARFCLRCGAAISRVTTEEIEATASQADSARPQPGDEVPDVADREMSGEALPIPENIAGAMAYVTIVPAVVFLFLPWPTRRQRRSWERRPCRAAACGRCAAVRDAPSSPPVCCLYPWKAAPDWPATAGLPEAPDRNGG